LRKAGEESGQLKQVAESAGQTLEEERARGAALASELAKARGEIETQVAQLRKAGEESVRLKQVAESAGQTLEEGRARSAALMSELAKARGEIETQAAQLRKAGEDSVQLKQVAESVIQGQTLEEEHARSAALMSELAKARGENETQAAQLRKAGEESVQLKQVAERAIMELRQSLQQERQKTEAMTRDLESARRSLDERVTTGRAANSDIAQQTKAAQAPATEQPAATEAQDNPEPTRLIARASALLGQGNIGAARIVLERAAQNGSAQASFMLAETYDPVILSAWGTYGTRGEATKARELYAKANAGGIQEAKDRLDALR
jgi:predicted  nucleic acid-binding Zn-ribbon protein